MSEDRSCAKCKYAMLTVDKEPCSSCRNTDHSLFEPKEDKTMTPKSHESHELYKTGDEDAPSYLKYRNGEVVVRMCRKCGRGEAGLTEPCARNNTETFDPTKPCWTKDGDEVVIYATDHPGEFPLIGRIGKSSSVYWWSKDGNAPNGNDMYSLTNTPPKKKFQRWVNLYDDGQLYGFIKDTSAAEHAKFCSRKLIETRLIEWEA